MEEGEFLRKNDFSDLLCLVADGQEQSSTRGFDHGKFNEAISEVI